jgi:hypothetical protein
MRQGLLAVQQPYYTHANAYGVISSFSNLPRTEGHSRSALSLTTCHSSTLAIICCTTGLYQMALSATRRDENVLKILVLTEHQKQS